VEYRRGVTLRSRAAGSRLAAGLVLWAVLLAVIGAWSPAAAFAASPSASPSPSATPSPAPSPKPPALTRPTARKPLRVWFGGDSLSGVPGIQFARLATATRVMRCSVDYQVSSRLISDLTFNWPAHMGQVMSARHPQAVVFMMGANEGGFSVTVNGKYLDFWRAGWRSYYRTRIARMVAIMVRGGAKRIFWVGMPMMGPRAFSGMNNQMRRINAIARQELKLHPSCRFIDAWKILSTSRGAYVDAYRGGDDIHLSPAGGKRLAAAVLAAIKKEWLPAQ